MAHGEEAGTFRDANIVELLESKPQNNKPLPTGD
jgi:hypothetical protein